jgi:hypothetical protein
VRPLWREDRPVIYSYNCFWALPEQLLSGPSPAELEGQVPVFISPVNRVAQLYPQSLGSLFVASYDSQGLIVFMLVICNTLMLHKYVIGPGVSASLHSGSVSISYTRSSFSQDHHVHSKENNFESLYSSKICYLTSFYIVLDQMWWGFLYPSTYSATCFGRVTIFK